MKIYSRLNSWFFLKKFGFVIKSVLILFSVIFMVFIYLWINQKDLVDQVDKRLQNLYFQTYNKKLMKAQGLSQKNKKKGYCSIYKFIE